jgi:hypothetical protein
MDGNQWSGTAFQAVEGPDNCCQDLQLAAPAVLESAAVGGAIFRSVPDETPRKRLQTGEADLSLPICLRRMLHKFDKDRPHEMWRWREQFGTRDGSYGIAGEPGRDVLTSRVIGVKTARLTPSARPFMFRPLMPDTARNAEIRDLLASPFFSPSCEPAQRRLRKPPATVIPASASIE